MKHAHLRSWLVGVVALALLASRPLLAVSPSYIMFYGAQLASPFVVKVDSSTPSGFLWETRARREGTLQRDDIPKHLAGRPYLDFAVFWGQWPDGPMKPEDASQHGRLYLPTATEPAAVVATVPNMESMDPNVRHPAAALVPVDLDEHGDAQGHRIGFVAGWILSAPDLAAAKRLGIPKL